MSNPKPHFLTLTQPDLELAPGFKAPSPTSYDDLRAYIDTQLPAESPAIYGGCCPPARAAAAAAGRKLLCAVQVAGPDAPAAAPCTVVSARCEC